MNLCSSSPHFVLKSKSQMKRAGGQSVTNSDHDCGIKEKPFAGSGAHAQKPKF